MKKIFLLFLLLSVVINAQDKTRGAIGTELSKNEIGKKHAIIIGISKYQEKNLELNYADNDAVLFKNYLNKVENLTEENIQLLINQEATSLNIIGAFKSLLKKTNSGDTVYIYFAGHGDVVDDFGEKEGFLLAADANASQEYYSGGVIPLSLLNNKILNAFTKKGAKIALVLDACRSGFLFEESTKTNLGSIQAMFENTTKFLSCGPNQLSYESSDLKHGYFTYFLVKGLLGEADENKDKKLQYREIDDYLYNNVASIVTSKLKQKQEPILSTQNTRANIREQIVSNTNFDFSNASKEAKQVTAAFKGRSVNTKKELSTEHQELIKTFNYALNRGDYYGKEYSALTIYKHSKNTNLPPVLVDKMQQLLLEKLSSGAQNLINNYIKGNELPNSIEFSKQAKHLEICLSILDKDDFLADNFHANKLVLEAYATIKSKNYLGYKRAKKRLNQALNIVPQGAYIHNALGLVYNAEERYDSAHFHFNKAKKLIHSWSSPTLNLSSNYLDQYKYEEAKDQMNTALGKNGDNTNNYLLLAKIADLEGKLHEAEKYYTKALEIESTNLTALQGMSIVQNKKGNTLNAEKWLKKAIASDSIETLINYGLLNYINNNKINRKTAESIFIDALKKRPNSSLVYTQYADFLRTNTFRVNRNKLTDSLYGKALKLNPFNESAYVGKANKFLKLRKKDLALQTYNKALLKNKLSPLLYYEKAGYYIKAYKNYKKALEFYTKAIEVDANYMPAYKAIISIYNKDNNTVQSITLLKKLTTEKPDVPEFWNLLGDTYFKDANYTDAINAYKTAVYKDKTYTKTLKNLAQSQVETNNFSAAKQNYLATLEANPLDKNKEDIISFLLSMAREKETFGTIDKAKELYKLAFELSPNNTTASKYALFLYLNNLPNDAILIASPFVDKSKNRDEFINILETLMKSAIDINDANLCNQYYQILLTKHRTTDYLLAAIYSRFMSDLNGYQSYFQKVNPELLKINKLKSKYSKATIENYINK